MTTHTPHDTISPKNSPSTGRALGRIFPVDAGPFPGRWIGGVSLIAGPLLLAAATILRYEFNFFYPDQLAAYRDHPGLIAAAYAAFALGCVFLVPATLALAARIAPRSPGWAIWGATMTIVGLLARTFHAGVDHLAFQMVNAQGLETTTAVISDAYTAGHAFKIFNTAIMIGWILLAVGAWRSGSLGPIRSLALAAMCALPLGVLKGTSLMSYVSIAGLCLALIPLGVTVLGDGAAPRPASVVRWTGLAVVLAAGMWFLGEAG